MSNVPTVTVLLPVRDGETTIAAALDSLVAQTFSDLEVWVLDDGSLDGTSDVVRSYGRSDPRVILHADARRVGRSERLNKALDVVRSPFVARMDADDVSLPGRLDAQLRFLDDHSDVDICGTWIRVTGYGEGAVWRLPQDPDVVQAAMLFRSVIAHPTVCARTDRLRDSGLRYRTDRRWAEDWDLWQRCANVLRLSNVPQVYLLYAARPPVDLDSPSGDAPQRRAEAESIINDNLLKLGIEASPEELALHRRIGNHDVRGELAFLEIADRWLQRLVAANSQVGRYDQRAFERLAAEHWFYLCYALSEHRGRSVARFLRSPLARDVRVPPARWARWIVRLAQGRRR